VFVSSFVARYLLPLTLQRSILIKMKHPNIVNLIKVVDDDAHNRCYLILEYVSGGELFDYIIAHGRLSEVDARRFMRQVRENEECLKLRVSFL
jgi:serine/threonine protein kinase